MNLSQSMDDDDAIVLRRRQPFRNAVSTLRTRVPFLA